HPKSTNMLHIDSPTHDNKHPVVEQQPAPTPPALLSQPAIVNSRRFDEICCSQCGEQYTLGEASCPRCCRSSITPHSTSTQPTPTTAATGKWRYAAFIALLLALVFYWP